MMNLPKLFSVLFAIASVGVLFYIAIRAAYTKGKLDGYKQMEDIGWSKVAKGVEEAAENYRKKS
jgi:hypothetical protein